ncbi:LEAF RUST 10 DISEASE-RESISTANCE LOCUS RECEPTOR-LIKE PROTEIN KINASE-like 2.3 [Tasmannia lanceolata]|uniref:LEAF RUST 10 DISEASE-RESISTANCE LOCUS RECEPTOR-LIKE PROTEIN KINASE-like 2.3 n=1 Tax=Tasmannia lanceolata TaxID=3420 RepID=UPI0040639B89
MKRSRSLSVAVLASLLSFFFFLGGCNAWRRDCHSSCGTLQNITYPFRLTTDPEDCGITHLDSNFHLSYQLACDDNRAVLNFRSGKYYVEEISYEKKVIRLVDSDLQKGNCSSLPPYSSGLYYDFDDDYGVYSIHSAYTIVFVKCSVPINNSEYKAATPCPATSSPDYLYFVMGNKMSISDLNETCESVARTAINMTAVGEVEISNFTQIQNLLPMGFELSWEILEFYSVYCYGLSSRTQCYAKAIWLFISDLVECTRHGIISIQAFFHTCKCGFDVCMVNVIPHLNFCLSHAMILLLQARTLIGVLCLAIFLAYKLRIRYIWMDSTVEEFLTKHRYRTPTRYSYSDIKKMTQGFKEKLGKGGFGTVFRGKLRSRRPVAIKMLAKSKANGKDFINEIATIGRIHHVNVIQLIGFCSEGSKRALIYDYMPNGSLEKYIFPQHKSIDHLSWEKTYKISLGIARGIEYLHRGCDMRILHFDIKPHNILLDENFIPKVSDFGLAKFYPMEKSIVSVTAIRGTPGYIAPELFLQNLGGVSYKSDVYSFGMLLIEMAGRRSNFNAMAENSSQIFFPLWIYDQVSQGDDFELENASDDEKDVAKKLIIVALWCIQMKPADRPSMGKVLEMLEGSVELLQIPPKPSLSSPTRVTNEDDGTEIDSMGSTSISENWLVSQGDEESSLLSVIVD